jgi:aryl-alcohol dehydrogenase-like predicted oxidoreductase
MGTDGRQPRFLDKRLNRRQVLKGLGLLGSAVALGGPLELARAVAETGTGGGGNPAGLRPSSGEIPRRPFGKTGIEVSVLCLGGAHLGRAGSEAEAIRIVHEAVDAGMTFMDNAWEYHNGLAEEVMGKALAGRRHQVFLMTKVCSHGRDKKVAMEQLEQSLRRLRTDYLDLWQIHEVIYEDDPDHHFAPGGAVEALLEAKKQGKVRFVGFTGHKDPMIHLKMLAHDFPFDACQMPLNVFDGTYRSFEQEVLPLLNKRGIAPLAMKTLSGNGEPIRQGVISAEEALRYVLSLPVATVVSGIDSRDVLRQNLDIARRFVPMAPEERVVLRNRAAAYAADGRFELFKSSRAYDGRIGREQHHIQS